MKPNNKTNAASNSLNSLANSAKNSFLRILGTLGKLKQQEEAELPITEEEKLAKAIGPLTEQEVTLAFNYLNNLRKSLREDPTKAIPKELEIDLKLEKNLRSIPNSYSVYLSSLCIAYNDNKDRFTVTFISDLSGDAPIEIEVTRKQMLALAEAEQLKKQLKQEEKKAERTQGLPIDKLREAYSIEPGDKTQRVKFRNALLEFQNDKELIKLVFESQPTKSLQHWIYKTMPAILEDLGPTDARRSFYSECGKLAGEILKAREEFEKAKTPLARHITLAIKYINFNIIGDGTADDSSVKKEKDGSYSVVVKIQQHSVEKKPNDPHGIVDIKFESTSEKRSFTQEKIIEFANLQAIREAKLALSNKIDTLSTTPVVSTTPTFKP